MGTMVRDLPLDERPRERLIKYGPRTLSNVELLAILLRVGSKSKSVIQLAQEVLGHYRERGFGMLSTVSVQELIKIKGIGSAKAAELVAAVEFGKRLTELTAKEDRPVISCPEDVAAYAMPRLRFEQREHFAVILLNVKNHILAMPTISIGSLTASIVHPREVFKAAIQHTAAAMILVHNHPSGDPTPSREDLALTDRLVKVGRMMDIPVLDHIIIGDNKFVSLKEQGFIK